MNLNFYLQDVCLFFKLRLGNVDTTGILKNFLIDTTKHI